VTHTCHFPISAFVGLHFQAIAVNLLRFGRLLIFFNEVQRLTVILVVFFPNITMNEEAMVHLFFYLYVYLYFWLLQNKETDNGD
jgi:hypothetical protein